VSGGSVAVAAECEADVQAAVAFAADHNMRLVVKSTGHDWFGRSSAPGSLMVWTHRLSAIAFQAEGGQAADALPTAVTVQAGVQLADLYRAAHAAGVVVMGGTCDSVGVGGCFLGGCFGVFTRKFGSAASNLLAARVVLANGSLVTASATSHADLFWALRGGGGGVAGVVTSFTARAFRAPRFVRGGKLPRHGGDGGGVCAAARGRTGRRRGGRRRRRRHGERRQHVLGPLGGGGWLPRRHRDQRERGHGARHHRRLRAACCVRGRCARARR
jgi:hypothetical protein